MISQKKIVNFNLWLMKNHGSRSGFVKSIWHQFLYYQGYYRQYKEIDWSRVGRLVFVCKGNICRSAYAEAVANSLGLEAISFGIDTRGNTPANPDAVRTAERFSIDLKQHKTTSLMTVDLKEGDLLVAMEPCQADSLRKKFNKKYQCTLLGLWVDPAAPYIHDPYGMRPIYFDKCFTAIQTGIQVLVEKIGQ